MTANETPNRAGTGKAFCAGLPAELIHSLDNSERAALDALAESLPSLLLNELDNSDFHIDLKLASDELPRSLRAFLTRFAIDSNDYGAIMIRNLPIMSVPQTPVSKMLALQHELTVTEKALLLLARQFGEPRGYEDEMSGAFIQQVFPIQGHERRQENSSSEELLLTHTEDGFLKERCDFLLLACLRPDHHRVALTGTASIRRAIDLLPSDVVAKLQEPKYIIMVPSSFGGDREGGPFWSELMPVLSGNSRRPNMCVDLDAMRGTDRESQAALACLGQTLKKIAVSMGLMQGEVLIIDNYVAAHSRSEFSPLYDGFDRWLLRVKVVSNPRQSRSSKTPGSRVVESVIPGRDKNEPHPHA